MYAEKTAWDDIADNASGVEGGHLKCAKGKWLLDDVAVETGASGIRLAVIMPTATAGKVKWVDGHIVERDIGLIGNGFAPARPMPDGYNPYISFLAVRADEGHVGELVTFTSSSWGGWFSFEKLVRIYRRIRFRQLPVVTLGTHERGDVNKNVDPVFNFVAWANPADFPDLVAQEDESSAAKVVPFQSRQALPSAQPNDIGATINDDIPF